MKKRIAQNGFTLLEVLIVSVIMAGILAGGYLVIASGRATWFTSGAEIELQENLRQALERMVGEIRQTQLAQQQIFNGAGANGTDVIRFSIPILCESIVNPLDNNGDVAYWGATLRWGCREKDCMDPDNNCGTVNYKYMEYRVDDQRRLWRRVLDANPNLVEQKIFAKDISDFQLSINGSVITVQMATEVKSEDNRVLTAQTSADVYLRN